jgi:soluble lytic murein transglycosylase-like protein
MMGFLKNKVKLSTALTLAAALVLSACLNGWLAYRIKHQPIKEVPVEKIKEVEVEKIKYVKQNGLKTPTDELIKVLNPKIDPQLAKIIAEHVEKASTTYGLPIPLILSVIRQESNFNPMAVSSAGAQGLMQVMPKIHAERYKGRNLFHISTNVDVGCQILREYLDKEGTLDKMFHAYLSKGAKKEVVNKYRNAIRTFWVKLEMHDYENEETDHTSPILAVPIKK